MPRRRDLESVLIIGSGPIVIGQACEFDYSGTQACKALREEGLRVILINSNPATIMTDPELADATYVEPLTVDVLDKVLERERPQAILPTLGGQTGLNLAMAAAKAGVLERHGVELLGASVRSIEMAEDREQFKQAMERIGLISPRSYLVSSVDEARAIIDDIGFPAILRPSFTLGGSGGGIAYNARELDRMVQFALDQSPVHQVLIEQSVLGWKEYELEVVRDTKDNTIIICSIENLDPMGVHTGDSITVAPAMTLTDKEYQRMRDASIAIMREIGVTTGGSNVQFAVDPATGRQMVIEMNPRVSRSSALASKATGFPIAKIAAKLAIGYTLDELQNDITRVTPASFEPTIDYVVVKWPRFAFEKFPMARATLGPQMKSVGEAMAIGRTFREALGKAIRSLETGRDGFDLPLGALGDDLPLLERAMAMPSAERLFQLARGFQLGLDLDRAHELTRIDPWFLRHIRDAAVIEQEVAAADDALADRALLRRAKRGGMSDRRIASLRGVAEAEVRAARDRLDLHPVFKRVDTCGAEYESHTPYLYSSYEEECEARPTDRRKVMILGGGPNRIGQGIEFDYCCVHAAMALAEEGIESIMVNCNPETVSTDYDTSDRLYFEPVTLEDVLEICRLERPSGVIVQFGGQTPLKLAVPLTRAGVPILGTTADAIDRAEDRERFGEVMAKLGLRAPRWGIARTLDEARTVAAEIGFPVMVRPSYVLGGRAMERVYDARTLEDYFERVLLAPARLGRAEDDAAAHSSGVGLPLLVDQFLADAVELDVDVVADATGAVIVGGVMEHIEEAGIHSGDSACSLPPYSLPADTIEEVRRQARLLAAELGVVGLMNVQFAVHAGEVFVIEVNPRASRTVPFVSKAIGVPLAKVAAKVMTGRTLAELGVTEVRPTHVAVKESVFPFVKFEEVDTILGPEMRSTGEVMGIDDSFVSAYVKAQLAAGVELPTGGTAFISVRDDDKGAAEALARRLLDLGFALVATHGTARHLEGAGLPVRGINKVLEGRPHCVDAFDNGEVDFIVNTTEGAQAILDSQSLRRGALRNQIAYFTTIRGAQAAVDAIALVRREGLRVAPLQGYH
ncbi:MAG: carbamoyl-phosphate synthase large subunit [Kofleriaceae bacterium]|nr:carbamoyl-phosphate synthase large subunit [Kofleriaceae bacterium]MCB9572402.1 carbamoyl-phosphate synthase large subunit [Kofleriaceae bacterium]